MRRTITIPGFPKWLLQPLAAGWVVFLLIWTTVLVLGYLVPGVAVGDFQSSIPLTALVLLWAGLTAAWVRRARRRSDDRSSWWGPVPSWQYNGRFAGHGGLARDSWERSLPRARDDDDESEWAAPEREDD